MTRVIHTGDTHLGYRQYHSPERREDFLAAFRAVVDDAIAEDADAVVHAGDLFHDRSPSLVDVHGAIHVLRDLRAADIPFLAIVGNHERTRDGQWLDLFQTLGLATRLGAEPTTVGDVAVYGLDFVPRSRRDALTYDFPGHDATFAVLVAHGLFTPFNAEWNLKALLEASTVDFDAVLLGDDHQPDVARVGGTWVTYCGSTERTSAAERDERGYNIVAFDAAAKGGVAARADAAADAESAPEPTPGTGVSIRRRGIETRPFVPLDLALEAGEGADRVRERLREEPLEDAVVVVGIEGEGEDLTPAHIEEFARERGAIVARVTDKRELQAAELEAVRFADPDAAVRERVRALGLSEAALAVDETVRSDVADSNVRARVRERVEALLDEPGALEPGEPVASDGSEEVVDATFDGDDDPGSPGPLEPGAAGTADAVTSNGGAVADDAGGETEDQRDEEATPDDDVPDRVGAKATPDDDEPDRGEDGADAGDDGEGRSEAGRDDQVTMEDYW